MADGGPTRAKRANGKKSSAWIRADLRWSIYVRDGFACAWCGTCVGDDLTLDHVFPVGSPWRDNAPCRLVTACRTCNTSRKAQRLSAWLRQLSEEDRTCAAAALRRRHAPLRRDVGRWARGAFTRRTEGVAPVPEGTPGLGADGALY